METKSDPAVDRKEKTQDRAAVINASSGDPGPSEKEPRTIGETAGKQNPEAARKLHEWERQMREK